LRDPGYSKEMIAARRDFFDVWHYAPLTDVVAERVRAVLPVGPERVVVDAGCGEGTTCGGFAASWNRTGTGQLAGKRPSVRSRYL
jgi:hypothetical protein